MSDEYHKGRQSTGNHNWGDPDLCNTCSICHGIGARATCTKCHNTCHSYCSKVVKRKRLCERCLEVVK
jgi:hypothetical protein